MGDIIPKLGVFRFWVACLRGCFVIIGALVLFWCFWLWVWFCVLVFVSILGFSVSGCFPEFWCFLVFFL